MNLNLRKLCLAAFLSACVAACTSGGPPDHCQLTYAGQAPLWRHGTRLLVPALINRKVVALMLDTGGEGSLMSAPDAGLLKLKPAPGPASATPLTISGLGGSRTAHVVLTDAIHFGDLRATGIPFVVPDQSPLRIANPDPDTLGMNFLTGFDVDVDVLGNRLVFYRTGELCASKHVLMPPPLYSAADVSGAQPDRPTVAASIRGLDVRALLDTGAPESLLFRNAAERLGLGASTLATDPRAQLRGISLNGVEAVRHSSEPITIGGLTISLTHIIVSPETDPAVDIVLGMDFLSKVHLWISNSSREVVLQFPPKAAGYKIKK